MDVEPIQDIIPTTVDINENYINDLEAEISSLKAQILKLSKLNKQLKQQPDKSCCFNYKRVLYNFHKLLDEVIPF